VMLCKKRRGRGEPQVYEVWRWEDMGGCLRGVPLDSRRFPLAMARALARKHAKALGLPFVEPESTRKMNPAPVSKEKDR
jgi:hypothetical protein